MDAIGQAEGPALTAAARAGMRDWSGVVLVAVCALFVGLGLAFAISRITTPFANDRIAPLGNIGALTAVGASVTTLDDGPTGLETGDVVTAIDGRQLSAWPALVKRAGHRRVGDSVVYTVLRQGNALEVPILVAPYPLGAVIGEQWGFLAYATVFLLIAAYVYYRRPALPAARAMLLAAATQFGATTWALGYNAADIVSGGAIWIYHVTALPGFMVALFALFHFALVFPRPVPFIRQRRWVLPVLYGSIFVILALYLGLTRVGAPNPLAWLGRWGWITTPHAALCLTATMVTIIWQYRHSDRDVRRQIRWLVLAGVIVSGTGTVVFFAPQLVGLPTSDSNTIGLVAVLFPAAVAISILRHNLFDIDVILNRTLVYATLTAVIVLVYVVVVGVIGTVFQAQGSLLVSLVATGLVAVLFQPLRERLQKGVNQLMYGERDEPFEVLARLGRRLEQSFTPESVYPTLVATLAEALKLPYVALAVYRDGEAEIVESYGIPTGDPVRFNLMHHADPVGEMIVGRRAPGEAFDAADERLLRNVARQAGAAVHAAQLMVDLQQSRQKLVTAREEERRRLRRDLHDGLGPQLASQTLTIEAIDRLLARDPERARALLRDLKRQSQAAVQDIRRLVYGLRPPALDELGLVGALEETAVRHSANGLRVAVEAAAGLPSLPAAIEVAVFRIAQEALTNAARHAGASRCVVAVEVIVRERRRELVLSIEDDGRGLPEGRRDGVGFQSMRERAAELGGRCRIESRSGGGVRVTAVLPLSTEESEWR